MQAICAYHIRLEGQVKEADLNVGSPLMIRVVQVDVAAATLEIQTDQSGMIGVIRYLHGQGFLLLSVVRILEKEK